MHVCVIQTDLLLLTVHLFSRISPSCLPLWHLWHQITHLKAELIQFPSQIPLLQGGLAQREAAILSHHCAKHSCTHCTLLEGLLSIQILGKQQQDRDECAGPATGCL